MINSNYIEPSFPPCEEYPQNGYLPAPSEYYEPPKGPGFAHQDEASFQRSNYPEPGYEYSSAHPNGLEEFPGHIPPQPVPQNHDIRVISNGDEGAVAPKGCSLSNDSLPPAQKAKEPVVYPWMKKVHVNTGKLLGCLNKMPPWIPTPAPRNARTPIIAAATFRIFTSDS